MNSIKTVFFQLPFYRLIQSSHDNFSTDYKLIATGIYNTLCAIENPFNVLTEVSLGIVYGISQNIN